MERQLIPYTKAVGAMKLATEAKDFVEGAEKRAKKIQEQIDNPKNNALE